MKKSPNDIRPCIRWDGLDVQKRSRLRRYGYVPKVRLLLRAIRSRWMVAG